MATLDVCNFCQGQGYTHFYHSRGEPGETAPDTRPCPACHGSGHLDAWRQVGTGVHAPLGWTSTPAYREMSDAIRAIIRLREES
jgi:DnaJ-class molecular chaperone